jgi:hypothetical protein
MMSTSFFNAPTSFFRNVAMFVPPSLFDCLGFVVYRTHHLVPRRTRERRGPAPWTEIFLRRQVVVHPRTTNRTLFVFEFLHTTSTPFQQN